jgi:hypothetical protein
MPPTHVYNRFANRMFRQLSCNRETEGSRDGISTGVKFLSCGITEVCCRQTNCGQKRMISTLGLEPENQ